MKEIEKHIVSMALAFLAMCLIFAASPIQARAADIASGTSGTCSWVIDDFGIMTISPTNGSSGQLDSYMGTYDSPSIPWYNWRKSVRQVIVEPGVRTGAGCCNLFSEFSYCSTMDLKNLDTSEATNMSGMFYDCSDLSSLDLSNFDTSNVTNMEGMFYYCSDLESLNISSFNTSNVTDMSSMFRELSKLVSLDVSGFTTSSVTDMSEMFYDCSTITSLDVSKFDTSHVVNMNSMFQNCCKLTALNVSGFNTSKVTDMGSMFSGCFGITSLDVSSFDTSKVTDMSNIFHEDIFTSLDLSNWNTSNTTTMMGMFDQCDKLTSLNLSGFDTSKVQYMHYMFEGCESLVDLDISGFDTSQTTNMTDMFYHCGVLKQIKLGEKFSFKGNNIQTSRYQAVLPTPSGNAYTGNWINKDKDVSPYTAEDLKDNYTPSMAGTWVWEKTPTTYTIVFSAGDTGAGGAMPNQKIEAAEEGTINECSLYKFDHSFDHWVVNDIKSSKTKSYAKGYNEGDTIPSGNIIPANTYAAGDTITLTPVFVQDSHSITLNNGEGSFEMNGGTTIEIPDIPAGTSYQIWEETPDGWVLVYQENASGTVEALQSSNALFTNRYQPGTTGVQFSGTKTLDNKAAAAGSFSFQLIENGSVLQTKEVLEGGFIQFDPIEYDDTMLGTHTYTIREVIDTTQETIDFDRHDETVTVTVSDNGDGTLSSVVVYDTDGIKFENKTRPGILTLTKIGNGAVAGVTDDDEFTFKITFYNENGVPLNDEDIYYYFEGDSASSVAKEKSNRKLTSAKKVLEEAFGRLEEEKEDINVATPSNAREKEQKS